MGNDYQTGNGPKTRKVDEWGLSIDGKGPQMREVDEWGLAKDGSRTKSVASLLTAEKPIHANSAAPLEGDGLKTAQMLASAVPQVAGALLKHAAEMALRNQGPSMSAAAKPAAHKMNPFMLHMKPLELKPPGAK